MAKPERDEAIRAPRGVRIDIAPDGLKIGWKHHRGPALTLIRVGLAIMVGAGAFMTVGADLEEASMILILGAVSAVLGLSDVGWTELRLDRQRLAASAWSVPFLRPIRDRLPAAAIRQVYVVERSVGRYELHLVFDGRQSRPICTRSMGGDLDIDMALYLKEVIESFLGLRGQPVAGRAETSVRYRSLGRGPFEDYGRAVSFYSDGVLADKNQPRAETVLPDGFELWSDVGQLAVGWPEKRMNGTLRAIMIVSAVFMGWLLVLVVMAGDPRAMIAYGLCASALLALAWWRGVSYFTRMHMVCDGRELIIGHRPSWFRRGRRLSVDDVRQFYVDEHVSFEGAGRYGLGELREASTPALPRLEYHLTAVAEEKRVVAVFEDAPSALFMERELERFLQIDDHPVQGELKTKYRW